MNSGRTTKSIDFEARVVGYNQFAGNGKAVGLRFLARIFFKAGAVLDDRRQGSEVRNIGDGDADGLGCSGKIAQLASVRGCQENGARDRSHAT